MNEIVKIRKPEHGSEAWHLKRRAYKGKPIFSASEIAALMGGSQIQMPQFQGYQGAQVAAAPIFGALTVLTFGLSVLRY